MHCQLPYFPKQYDFTKITINQAPSIGSPENTTLFNLLDKFSLLETDKSASKESELEESELEKYVTSLDGKIKVALTVLEQNKSKKSYDLLQQAQEKKLFNPRADKNFDTWKEIIDGLCLHGHGTQLIYFFH